jgi:predicted Zn finger-like uncharacterized protein
MAIKTSCPHCDQVYALNDNQAGKTVRCRSCRESFTVAAPGGRSRGRDEDERPRRRERRERDDDEDRDEDRGRRRRPRRRGIPVWVWLLGVLMLLVLVGGSVGVALWMRGGISGPGGGGLFGGSKPLTRENFEKVTAGMPEREVVDILGPPDRAEGMSGPLARWDQIEALKTMTWESGSTKIEVVCTGGSVNHMKGTFNDPNEATPAAWTEANFNKLKWNMTRAEVRALLGPPQEISGGGTFDLKPSTTYGWRQGANEIAASFQIDKLYLATATLNGKYLLLRQRPLEIPDSKLPTGPSKLTEANFRRIKPKMTPQQVQAILGPPQDEGGGFAHNWLDARGNSVQVLFQDNKAVIISAVINGKKLDTMAPP